MEVGYKADGNRSSTSVSWEELKLGDEGRAIDLDGVISATVQVSGTFGVAGCLELEGSNNGEYFMPLKDAYGRPLKKFEAGIDNLGQMVKFIRPVVKSGDVDTDLKCSVYLHRRV